LFDIIVDFPESTAALEDLLKCLNKTHQHPELVRSLHSMFQKRLLHPGAQTSDIITQYILTIKALYLLDPSGILLESVSNCIKDYLRLSLFLPISSYHYCDCYYFTLC
jgi:anaphase-promoting complex subunit 2